jgi:hypothetical protein
MSEKGSVTETLRKPFKTEEIGKLPRVTCPKCSDRKQHCDEHVKVKCRECQAYVSERHIHIDYVGHADVTARLLEADEEWTWEPKAKDIDPAVLAAAVATGNAELVRTVLENAPPRFDLDERGDPVGLWILLTVGGVTRPGYGSVPSGQPDAVKVLIGDALRNAAMRFGVALALWAKGDRADPTAENATASAGQARRGRQPAREPSENAVPAPRQQASESAPEPDEAVIANWGAKVDGITSQEDATLADKELREVFKAGRMDAATANAIRNAIKTKAASLSNGTPQMAGAAQ